MDVITANPKTAGVARWNFFALWGARMDKGEAAALDYVTKVCSILHHPGQIWCGFFLARQHNACKQLPPLQCYCPKFPILSRPRVRLLPWTLAIGWETSYVGVSEVKIMSDETHTACSEVSLLLALSRFVLQLTNASLLPWPLLPEWSRAC